MILPLVILGLSIVCRAMAELQQHGKLRWMDHEKPFSFWGKLSHRRKYKRYNSASGERWPTSTTITVFLTDFYHLMQFLHHILLSLSVALLTDISYFIFIWPAIVLVHSLTYKLLQ